MPTTITSNGLEPRRKKALYQAWHRGTKEMDILLGEFADARIAHLSVADLSDFERILVEKDQDLFSWIIGTELTPVDRQSAVFAELVAFHAGKHAA
jgi:antitoxin CptB